MPDKLNVTAVFAPQHLYRHVIMDLHGLIYAGVQFVDPVGLDDYALSKTAFFYTHNCFLHLFFGHVGAGVLLLRESLAIRS